MKLRACWRREAKPFEPQGAANVWFSLLILEDKAQNLKCNILPSQKRRNVKITPLLRATPHSFLDVNWIFMIDISCANFYIWINVCWNREAEPKKNSAIFQISFIAHFGLLILLHSSSLIRRSAVCERQVMLLTYLRWRERKLRGAFTYRSIIVWTLQLPFEARETQLFHNLLMCLQPWRESVKIISRF